MRYSHSDNAQRSSNQMRMPGCRVCNSRGDHFAAVEAGHRRRLVTDSRLWQYNSHWHWDPSRWQRFSRLRLSACHWRRMWIQVRCRKVFRRALGYTRRIRLRPWNHKPILRVPYYSWIWWREIVRRWRNSTWPLNCCHSVYNTEQNKAAKLRHSQRTNIRKTNFNMFTLQIFQLFTTNFTMQNVEIRKIGRQKQRRNPKLYVWLWRHLSNGNTNVKYIFNLLRSWRIGKLKTVRCRWPKVLSFFFAEIAE